MIAVSALVVVVGLIVIFVAVIRERKLAHLKSEFVANVSHELKTPLSLVRMFSEMLLTGRASDEKKVKYLEIIVAESERLSVLIDNVLDFSRMDRGKQSFEFRNAAIIDTVTRAVDVCRVRAERQSVELELNIDAEGETSARIDERAIEIAVINLIDNALKYATETKRVAIELRSEGKFWKVSVRDWGPGVPEEDRKRVFERFVRGAHRSGDSGRGSGIGLAMVAQISRAHGGRVWVEDAEPHGARFVMTVRA